MRSTLNKASASKGCKQVGNEQNTQLIEIINQLTIILRTAIIGPLNSFAMIGLSLDLRVAVIDSACSSWCVN